MGVAAVIVSDATDVDLVKRALESVLYQTCPVDEIVIVEAKRRVTNDLEEMIGMVGSNIILDHFHCYNASMARNHGARLCTSEFICFLDGDDEWSPHMIADRMELIRDDVCLITSKYAMMTDLKGTLRRFMPSEPIGRELYGRNIIGSNSYAMMRRDLFLKLGGFDPELVYHQDWDLWIRLLNHGKVAISSSLGGIKYYNQFSASRNLSVCREGWVRFAKKWAHIYHHDSLLADSFVELCDADMYRFGESVRVFGTPLGRFCRKILCRSPFWTTPHLCWSHMERDLVIGLDEATHMKVMCRTEKRMEFRRSSITYPFYPLFKNKRIRCSVGRA